MASPTTSPSTLGFLQQSMPPVGDDKEEKESESTEERALHSSKARFWVYVIIISAYIAAVILVIVHTVFLSTLDLVDPTQYSFNARSWLGRASNLISKLVATSLSVVVATALIQGVRFSQRKRSYL
jgi:hypothetical protein